MNIKRGDVLLVNFNPIKGSEQGKIRPCVVIQNDIANKYSPTTIVLPLSSNIDKVYPFDTIIKKGLGGLKADSVVLGNQIRVISIVQRVKKVLGSLDKNTMINVDKSIKDSLALE